MKKKYRYGLISLGAVVLSAGAKMINDTCLFKQNNEVFWTNKYKAETNFRLAQISDLHNRTFDKDNRQLLAAIKANHPDVVVITGDLIDRRTRRFASIYAFIEKLKADHDQVYFISGNHEWEHHAYQLFVNGLIKRGVTVLDKEVVQLTKHGSTLNLVGLGYEAEMEGHSSSRRSSVNEDTYNVWLMHTPNLANDVDMEADLMLCGHTHGGQVRFPLIGAIMAPDQGLFPRWAKGVYALDNNRFLYVDSGLGTTHMPIRFLNPSQFSIIDIKGNSEK